MPITDTLQNAKRLEAVGFNAEQSRGISEIVEEAVHAGQQDLKDFIRGEISGLRSEISAEFQAVRGEMATLRAELKADMSELRAEFHSALRDQLLKFITIMATMITLAVVIIKIFPNA